jgi:hypothetical protein
MKFLVHRARLVRLLTIVTTDSSAPKKKREGLVRLHAEGSLLSVNCNGEVAQCEAAVQRPGVCFLRHFKLRQLLLAYSKDKRHHDEIEIEVTPHSIRFGETLLPREGWEISLFLNPESAPERLVFLEEDADDRPPPIQMMLPIDPGKRGSWKGPK